MCSPATAEPEETTMQRNGLKRLWEQGTPVINGWLSIGDAFCAEIMAEQGYDALTVDLQHGLGDHRAAVAMFQAIRASGVVPLARAPWLDPAAIMKLVDAGALGIVCPMIETAEEAARFVSYLRYPPLGMRSFGPTRAVFSAGPNYGEEADDNILAFAMIETPRGWDALEAIAETPGLDGLYIGPADLSLALTGRTHRLGFDREEPELVAAIDRIRDVAHRAGLRAALHCGSPEYAARAIDRGFDLVTVTNDVRLLASAAAASVATTKKRSVRLSTPPHDGV
jgi:4-hydroxy-2-oxoheptanedioate aldolase